MSREIEIKLPISDLPATVKRLKALGAKRVGRVFEQNTLFDTADEHFRQHQSILRIRVEESADHRSKPCSRSKGKPACEGQLTFKCPAKRPQANRPQANRRVSQSRYKERQEIEYHLRDVRRFTRLLKRLGLRAWFQYEKYRTRYRLADSALHIDLDETPIGAFLELEGPRRSIDHAAKALGFSEHDYITASYLELYADACARNGVSVANMVFSAKKNANSRTLRLTKLASTLNK